MYDWQGQGEENVCYIKNVYIAGGTAEAEALKMSLHMKSDYLITA